jgi:hypothetical protein
MIVYDKATHEPCKSAPHDGQVEITLNGFTFPADRELVFLLCALNKAGLQTYSHCAGHGPGHGAWVVLELDGVNVEIRQRNGRPQMVLSWQPPWLPPAQIETDAGGAE